ncbi:Hypothetical protein [Corynebacterium glutamicum ATCC 13032]|uniref:Uncharacterized protein n=1 Tax=Corynebacterium glutamicum (strain ATCC 13032 / DSM 20300 / JCM 1318 / BCRC 11384 / CCUG 27702 / LMG 3730 / NBRC 12168 / NCIMB 10025 / NRRL B-2784 / 534) TaxID=196627 RepID=Q8NPM7_CORGL|nr:Hypothetical protein [Corynebacterium glutamicum ATCC 13032]
MVHFTIKLLNIGSYFTPNIFPSSVSPIRYMLPLGAHSDPARLGCACNTSGRFINSSLTCPLRALTHFYAEQFKSRTFASSSVISLDNILTLGSFWTPGISAAHQITLTLS